MHFPVTNIAGEIRQKYANGSESSSSPVLIVAAGTGDATKITGQSIDRYNGVALARSAVVTTGYMVELTATKTFALAHEYQDSADNSTWNTAVAIEASTVKETGSATTVFRDVDEHTLNLDGLQRYIRINVTPDFSAAATDTGWFMTMVTLGGHDQGPQ